MYGKQAGERMRRKNEGENWGMRIIKIAMVGSGFTTTIRELKIAKRKGVKMISIIPARDWNSGEFVWKRFLSETRLMEML